MKKLFAAIALMTVIAGMLVLVSGCGQTKPTKTPDKAPSIALPEKPEELCTQTEGMITTSKGQNLFGVTVLPNDYEGKLPTIILCHGYGSDYGATIDKAIYFASMGYASYCFDFCGGSTLSKSDGDFLSTMTIDTEVSDLEDVIAYLCEQPFVDTGKLFLYGESQGGFIAAIVASKNPENYAGLIMMYPALNIPEHCHDGNALTSRENYVNSAVKYYGKVDDMLAACTMPVLLFHGDADPLVDISNSEHAKDIIPNCRYEVVKKAGHGFSKGIMKTVYPSIFEYLKDACK